MNKFLTYPRIHLFPVILIALLAGSCRSHRQTVSSATLVAASDSTSVTVCTDSVRQSESSRSLTAVDSVSSLCEGLLVIDRDSSGMPVRYRWHTASRGNSFSAHALNESEFSRRSAASDSVRDTHHSDILASEESKREYEYSSRAECFIGTALLALALVYVFYALVKDILMPWIKNRKQ